MKDFIDQKLYSFSDAFSIVNEKLKEIPYYFNLCFTKYCFILN